MREFDVSWAKGDTREVVEGWEKYMCTMMGAMKDYMLNKIDRAESGEVGVMDEVEHEEFMKLGFLLMEWCQGARRFLGIKHEIPGMPN